MEGPIREKIRSINQDSFYISNETIGNLPNLYIIADGMGGHKAGEYASMCAVEEFFELYEDTST